jgi:hypothetical protein
MKNEELFARGDPNSREEQILGDPAASFWIKEALRSALARDPVDAANDAEVLAELLSSRCGRLLNAMKIAANADLMDVLSQPLAMPSCHVCGNKMEPICTHCGATTNATDPETKLPK